MSDNNGRTYMNMTIFIEDHMGKKRPFQVGYAYKNDKGDLAFKLTGMPMPGAKTDFSGVIQKREDKPSASRDDDGFP